MSAPSDKRTNIMLWTGVAASVAGICAVIASIKWQEKKRCVEGENPDNLRGAHNVLEECYEKIREIERRLPHIPALDE